jgi:hypothetical protein
MQAAQRALADPNWRDAVSSPSSSSSSSSDDVAQSLPRGWVWVTRDSMVEPAQPVPSREESASGRFVYTYIRSPYYIDKESLLNR